MLQKQHGCQAMGPWPPEISIKDAGRGGGTGYRFRWPFQRDHDSPSGSKASPL